MNIDPDNCNHEPTNPRYRVRTTECRHCKIILSPKIRYGKKTWEIVRPVFNSGGYCITIQESWRRKRK